MSKVNPKHVLIYGACTILPVIGVVVFLAAAFGFFFGDPGAKDLATAQKYHTEATAKLETVQKDFDTKWADSATTIKPGIEPKRISFEVDKLRTELINGAVADAQKGVDPETSQAIVDKAKLVANIQPVLVDMSGRAYIYTALVNFHEDKGDTISAQAVLRCELSNVPAKCETRWVTEHIGNESLETHEVNSDTNKEKKDK